MIKKFCVFVLLVIAHPKLNAAEFKIGVNDAYRSDAVRQEVQRLFDRIYAPLGIQPELHFLPSKRGLFLANNEKLDAESGRVLSVAEQYENLAIVPEPLIHHDIMYFCIDKQYCMNAENIRYALISGFEGGKLYCRENQLDCLYDQSPTFLAKAFANGAIESLIGSKVTASIMLCQSGINKIYFRSVPNLEIISFHLVNQKHSDKLSELAQSIKHLKQNGLMQKFVDATSKLPETCNVAFVDLG